MVINNDNEFHGQSNFNQVNVTYNIYINSVPDAIPETVPKKDSVSLFDKVMPYVHSFFKWAIKFIPLIIPLHSG